MPASNAHVVALLRERATRFWDRVDRSNGPDECWPWMLGRTPAGYGRVTFTSRGSTAAFATHRVAYMIGKGPIPDGLQIDHLCMYPPCCNPAHLEAVTPMENKRRAAAVRPTGSVERRVGRTGIVRWRVRFREDGKNRALTFESEDDARQFHAQRNTRRLAS